MDSIRRPPAFSIALRSSAFALALLTNAQVAQATCNQIPGTVNVFNGTRGAIDRPFASPGDVINLQLRPACDGDSGGFDGSAPVLSVIFTPPNGRRSMVVIAADCSAVETERQRCAASADIGTVRCQSSSRIEVLDAQHLRFAFPDTDDVVDATDDDRTLSGPATIAITAADAPLPCELASSTCEANPALLACIDTLFSVDGTCHGTPGTVFSHFTALPPPNNYQDLCTEPSPPCTGRASEVRFTIDSAGNALMPVDWRGVIFGSSVPIARLVRGSTSFTAFPDSADPIHVPSRAFLSSYSPQGGLLPPIFNPQADPDAPDQLTLFGTTDAPVGVLRLARRSPLFKQCSGGERAGLPCTEDTQCPEAVTDNSAQAKGPAPTSDSDYRRRGSFSPRRDATATTCAAAACLTGTNAGQPCRTDSDCPDSECGPSLFDFRTRLHAGIGPVLVQRRGAGVCQDSGLPCANDAACKGSLCVAYRAQAPSPVALDGLLESPDLFVSVVPEASAGRDLNGDGDRSDDVVVIRDQRSGELRPIGVSASVGRAATRIHEPPFSTPAVAVENDIVAFLEAEPLQGGEDANGDHDSFDTILRIFRITADGAQELTAGFNLAVDAAPLINGRSLVISNGRVYFRRSEPSEARQRIRRVSVASDGSEATGASVHPAISADGKTVAFESQASNLAGIRPAPPLLPELAREDGPRSLAVTASDSYVHELESGLTQRVPLLPGRFTPQGPATQPALSGDGRYVAVSAPGTNGDPQIWVTDRDADGNGVFDEPGTLQTSLISTDPTGTVLVKGTSVFPSLSPDGRTVTFNSTSIQLTDDVDNRVANTFWHNRDPDANQTFDELDRITTKSATATFEVDNLYGNASSVLQVAPTSADGRFTAYANFSRNIVANDTNEFCLNFFPNEQTSTNCADVFLWDFWNESQNPRDTVNTGPQRLSVGTNGEQGNQASLTPAMSRDGSHIAFQSFATNLVAGDTNGVTDIFVRNLTDPWHFLPVPDGHANTTHTHWRRTTTRASVSSSGEQANGSSFDRSTAISADGRYVGFASTASNLVPGDTNDTCDNDLDGIATENCADIFVHDQITGFTKRVSIGETGNQGNDRSSSPALAADGQKIAFQSRATNLVPQDTNDSCDNNRDGIAAENCTDIFVVDADPFTSGADVNGDGDVDDIVLQAFDTRSREVTTIGPAQQVVVVGSTLAFLQPDPDGPHAQVPAGYKQLGDGDPVDLRLYLSENGGPPQDMQQTARAIALSERWLAALVPELDVSGGDLDGNGRTTDTVLFVHRLGTGPDAWSNVGQAADSVQAVGDTIAFTVPELRFVDGTFKILTGSQRAADRVPRLYDAEQQMVTPIEARLNGASRQLPVDDYILGKHLLAFRVREAATESSLPACILNGDGDCADSVLFIYDQQTRQLINTGQAAIACPAEACDPRLPYRVLNDTVKFLTLESEQAADLNGDGDTDDLVLQTFNLANARLQPAGSAGSPASRQYKRTRRQADALEVGPLTTIGAASTGICTTSGKACVGPADCAGGQCFLPPGGCVVDTGTTCDPTAPVNDCGAGGFCLPSRLKPGTGTCQRQQGACHGDADCTAPATCSASGESIARLLSPLADASGTQVFITAAAGSGLAVAAAADRDADEIADPFDNCPSVANVDQADRNGNGVGDACEVAPATVTPTASSTLPPTSTPTTGPSGSGGCSIEPTMTGSGVGWLLIGALGLLLMRPRQRQAACRLSIALACLFAPAHAQPLVCPGDCDGNGRVTIDELITAVHLALDAEAPATCQALDHDADGTITVDEIIAAVDAALVGCGQILDSNTAAAAVGTTQALTQFVQTFVGAINFANDLTAAGRNAARTASSETSAADSYSNCPISGRSQRSCEQLDDGLAAIPIHLEDCTFPVPGALQSATGDIILTAAGACPGVFLPSNVRLRFDIDTAIADISGNVQRSATFHLAGNIHSLTFGTRPCALGSLELVVGGGVELNDTTQSVAIELPATAISVSFAVRSQRCQLNEATARLDGITRIRRSGDGSTQQIQATAHQLAIRLSNRGQRLDVNGGINVDCFGGVVQLTTPAGLTAAGSGDCPSGGTLNLSLASQQAVASFTSDGFHLEAAGGSRDYRDCIADSLVVCRP